MKNNLDLNKQLHFPLLAKAFRWVYDGTRWFQNNIRKYHNASRKFYDNIPDIKTIRIFGFGSPAIIGV